MDLGYSDTTQLGAVSRSERDAMARMVYADGGEMRRGDAVVLSHGGEVRIIGWDLARGLVMLHGPAGVSYAAPGELARPR